MAPTGVAALNVGGSTIQQALSFPYTTDSIPDDTILKSGEQLQKLQRRQKYALFYFCDEFGMVAGETLALMEERIRQAHVVGSDATPDYFGRRNVILFGHHAQLPPIANSRSGAVYPIPHYEAQKKGSVKCTDKDRRGRRIYKECFTDVCILRQQMRQRGASRFKDILDSICECTLTEEDYKYLSDHNDDVLGKGGLVDEWDVEYLCASLGAVKAKDHAALRNLHELSGEPIVKIQEIHTGDVRFALQAEKDKANGLEKTIFLSKGAKVMCNWNGWQEAGLVNGAVGTVYDIIYSKGEGPPSMPAAILVSFKEGDYYRGPSYLEDKDNDGDTDKKKERIVKFIPRTSNGKTKVPGTKDTWAPWTRIQFPLTLAYARTIHKSQGCTLEHIVGDLGPREFAAGLCYVLWSRTTSHDGICFNPFPSYSRMTTYKDVIRDRQQHERDLEQMAYGCCKRRFDDSVAEFKTMPRTRDQYSSIVRNWVNEDHVENKRRDDRRQGIVSGDDPLFMPARWKTRTKVTTTNKHAATEQTHYGGGVRSVADVIGSFLWQYSFRLTKEASDPSLKSKIAAAEYVKNLRDEKAKKTKEARLFVADQKQQQKSESCNDRYRKED